MRGLHEAGVALVSTGGSAALIEKLGLPVTRVEDLTGFPECLDGRVKTLHPKVHAGILADRRLESHVQQLADLGVEPFDLVVSNLYPFTETVMSGAGPDECVEQIDIGGPSMVRAAAKNHPSVAIVTSPDRYADVLAAVGAGGFTLAERQRLAAEAFVHTATYDVHVASWMGNVLTDTSEGSGYPAWMGATWDRKAVLRYGENPHQSAALFTNGFQPEPGLAQATQLHGKEMSYNNYVDGDAARRAAYDFDEPAVAIIKHANPCGIAVGADVAEAHRKAHECDPTSAFGGVIATNVPVSVEMATQVAEIFTEVLVAPSYDEGAVEVLQAKKNIRLLVCAPLRRGGNDLRPISGGLLLQGRDVIDAGGRRPRVLDPRQRRGAPRRRAGRPGVRVARLPFGEVQRDPARPRRRLRRRRHGPGQPGGLLQARRHPGRRPREGLVRRLRRVLPVPRRPADPDRRRRPRDRPARRLRPRQRGDRGRHHRRRHHVPHGHPPLLPLTGRERSRTGTCAVSRPRVPRMTP